MTTADKTIALIADNLVHARAGTERQFTRLGMALREAGWDCNVTVLRDSSFTGSGQFPLPLDCLRIGRMASPLSWWRAASFARSLSRDGVGLAHLFFNDSSVLLPPFLKAAGMKVVISRRDMGFWYTPGVLRVLQQTRRFVDAVVANSEAVAEQTVASEGYRREQIHVIRNALDPSFGAEDIPPADATAPVVGIVANIRPVKRIEDAVQSLAELRHRIPKLQLRIVGGGDPAPIQRCAESAGVDERVEFTGPCEDPAAEMSRFTIGLLTSQTEGFSNTLMEYQQMGLPVVSSDGGGNPEIVSDGRTGLLYPAGDVRKLADCLERLVTDSELRTRLGEAGRRSVRRLCDPHVVLNAHKRLYNSLLQQGMPAAAREGGC